MYIYVCMSRWLCKLCKTCNTKSAHLHKNLRSLQLFATRYREFYLLCYSTSLYISLSGKLIYRFIFHSNRKTRETNELIRLTLINFDYYEQSCESNFLLSFRSKICKNVSLSFFFFFFNFTVCLKYRLQIMYNIP